MPANNTLHQSFKEIAKCFSIPEDQIQTILERIKIKSSAKPSSEQLQGFEKVCDMLRSGTQLDVAVEAIHTEAKTNQTDKHRAEPGASANGGTPSDTSLAVTESSAILNHDGKEFAQNYNWQGLEQSVKEVAQQVAPEARQKFVKGAAEEADHVAAGMYAYGRYVMHEELREEIGKGEFKQVKEEIIKAIRTGKSQKGSPEKSP